jgi:hypothetical protein
MLHAGLSHALLTQLLQAFFPSRHQLVTKKPGEHKKHNSQLLQVSHAADFWQHLCQLDLVQANSADACQAPECCLAGVSHASPTQLLQVFRHERVTKEP